MHCAGLPRQRSLKNISSAFSTAYMENSPLVIMSDYLLECKAQDGNLLSTDCIEHARDDALHKAILLVVIYLNHRVPILRNPLQANALAVQNQRYASIFKCPGKPCFSL